MAEEQAINTLLTGNNYSLTQKRATYDLATIGIAAVKNSFTKAGGVKVEYVDPANLVWSYTESPYFDDIYYCGAGSFPCGSVAGTPGYMCAKHIINFN